MSFGEECNSLTSRWAAFPFLPLDTARSHAVRFAGNLANHSDPYKVSALDVCRTSDLTWSRLTEIAVQPVQHFSNNRRADFRHENRVADWQDFKSDISVTVPKSELTFFETLEAQFFQERISYRKWGRSADRAGAMGDVDQVAS